MKNITLGIIIGICLTITVFALNYNLKLNKRISSLEVFATQVANIINSNAEKTK